MKGYYRYIYGVLDGSVIAGKNIRLMCQRFLMMKDRDDIYFDEGIMVKNINENVLLVF